MNQPPGPAAPLWGAYRTAHDRVPRPPRIPTPLAHAVLLSAHGARGASLWVGGAFLVIGTVMSTVFCWRLPMDVALDVSGVRVQGTVVRTEVNHSVSINHRNPTEITFSYRVGRSTYEATSSTLESQMILAAREGAVVPVQVFPLVPAWARVQGTTASSFGYFGALTLIFPSLGTVLMIAALRGLRRNQRAFTHGIPTTGLIVKRGPNTSIRINGSHPYQIVWEFQVDQHRYRGSVSHMNAQLLGRVLPGPEVTVLYDQHEPSINTVWFE
ncbi:DUF3592 domain-containing protein [Chondromyces crocatus]|uniref:DUF3592 domain-containing protein n=1 Tax=Chondromyces crocatus TaxID=52 RepID=A0A0K1EI78_CHOCO|nr:DUF3592 domain-containing protein [Chondromyces crocatus]AKT40402.1 uncharacterized protein CMC5_045550 [Chondromyces crocatus]